MLLSEIGERGEWQGCTPVHVYACTLTHMHVHACMYVYLTHLYMHQCLHISDTHVYASMSAYASMYAYLRRVSEGGNTTTHMYILSVAVVRCQRGKSRGAHMYIPTALVHQHCIPTQRQRGRQYNTHMYILGVVAHVCIYMYI
jgi:hypothetical protein